VTTNPGEDEPTQPFTLSDEIEDSEYMEILPEPRELTPDDFHRIYGPTPPDTPDERPA
jgi:hypothetical protein